MFNLKTLTKIMHEWFERECTTEQHVHAIMNENFQLFTFVQTVFRYGSKILFM